MAPSGLAGLSGKVTNMPKGGSGRGSSQADRDNRSNQLNPNNDAYQSSRGETKDDEEQDEDDD